MTTNADKSNQLAANREQHMATIQRSLQTAYAALNDLPDEQRIPAQESLLAIWRKNLAIADLVEQAGRHLAEADATLIGMTEALRQVTDQRDQILGELDSITQAMVSAYGGDHPLVNEFRDSVIEGHNQAFWESLPYDFAQMLGEDWSHFDADDLYTALTINLEEKNDDASDTGYTRDELVAFREHILASVRHFLQSKS